MVMEHGWPWPVTEKLQRAQGLLLVCGHREQVLSLQQILCVEQHIPMDIGSVLVGALLILEN